MNAHERRTDMAAQHRIEELVARVLAAREEIVEAGLNAVHGMRPAPATGAAQRAAGRSLAV
jgi:hypothetical protein